MRWAGGSGQGNVPTSGVARGFPDLLFYVPADDHLDIWRGLHAHRDIPAHLVADP